MQMGGLRACMHNAGILTWSILSRSWVGGSEGFQQVNGTEAIFCQITHLRSSIAHDGFGEIVGKLGV